MKKFSLTDASGNKVNVELLASGGVRIVTHDERGNPSTLELDAVRTGLLGANLSKHSLATGRRFLEQLTGG